MFEDTFIRFLSKKRDIASFEFAAHVFTNTVIISRPLDLTVILSFQNHLCIVYV